VPKGIKEIIEEQVEEQSETKMENMSDITLGGIIDFLSSVDPKLVLKNGFSNPHSYRGFYEDLAFVRCENVSVADCLALAKSALGASFFGRKGGEFHTNSDTTCWLVNEQWDTTDNPIEDAWLKAEVEDAKSKKTPYKREFTRSSVTCNDPAAAWPPRLQFGPTEKEKVTYQVGILVQRLVPEAILPTRGTDHSSGYGLHAIKDTVIAPGETETIDIGIVMEFIPGYEIQIRPLSSMAKQGITIPNSPVTIDADYRGPISVPLTNNSPRPFYINQGDRIAQMVLWLVPKYAVFETDKIWPQPQVKEQ